MNGGECECRVFGRLESHNRLKLEITTWELITDDEKAREANREFFTILKKVVIETRVLVPRAR